MAYPKCRPKEHRNLTPHPKRHSKRFFSLLSHRPISFRFSGHFAPNVRQEERRILQQRFVGVFCGFR
jgi:hypothetical protein